jgi:diacylglycerol kinase family enzyme
MSLQPIPVTNDESAKNIARQILQQIKFLKENIERLRTKGVPSRPASPERVLADGRVIPAMPAAIAISPDAINAALGVDNCEILDKIKDAIE